MKKPTEIISEAVEAGCVSVEDFCIWAYNKGQSDAYDEVMQDMEEIVGDEPTESFPLFAEESIRLQKQKEEKEHYADYSDQEVSV